MKRRDFLLVRDVLRGAEYLNPEDRTTLAQDFADAIKVQPGTDPRFDTEKFVHEATHAPVRPAEPYDPAKDPNGQYVAAVVEAHEGNQGRKPHWYADDVAYAEDRRTMMSWTPKQCTCDQPWRHSEPLA